MSIQNPTGSRLCPAPKYALTNLITLDTARSNVCRDHSFNIFGTERPTHTPLTEGDRAMKTRKLALAFLMGIVLTVALNLVPAATLWADKADESPSLSRADLQSTYGQLPMSFEVNQGQADPRVQFLSRGHGHQLFLTSSEAVLALGTGEAKGTPPSASQSVVRMTFEGANPHAELVGLEKLPGIVNYFLGSDSSKWHTNIPTYKKVEYKNVYTGIDVAYYGNQGQLEYDLIVAPGADPNLIRLVFDGAKTVKVDPGTGDLTLTLSASSTNPELKSDAEFAPTLRFQKPVAYQLGEHGDKHFLASRYVLMPSETSSLTAPVAFQVAAYDASKPLIIDPVLSWATYLGGSGNDGSQSIAVDTTGNAYVTGSTTTSGSGFTGTAGSSFQSIHAGGTWDAYVTKINAAGSEIGRAHV